MVSTTTAAKHAAPTSEEMLASAPKRTSDTSTATTNTSIMDQRPTASMNR